MDENTLLQNREGEVPDSVWRRLKDGDRLVCILEIGRPCVCAQIAHKNEFSWLCHIHAWNVLALGMVFLSTLENSQVAFQSLALDEIAKVARKRARVLGRNWSRYPGKKAMCLGGIGQGSLEKGHGT